VCECRSVWVCRFYIFLILHLNETGSPLPKLLRAKTEEIFRVYKVLLQLYFQNSSYASTADKDYLLSVLKISWRKNSMKRCRAVSRFEMWMLSEVSGVNTIPIFLQPENWEGVTPWYVGEILQLDAAVCPIIFHWKFICYLNITVFFTRYKFQNVGQNHNIKIANKPCESEAKFQYFVMTRTRKHCLQEE
jgi:hypothetical protein